MTSFGYTLMTEQGGPKQLMGCAAAERLGFDSEVMSDHYLPWLEEMGHAPFRLGCGGRGRARPPSGSS